MSYQFPTPEPRQNQKEMAQKQVQVECKCVQEKLRAANFSIRYEDWLTDRWSRELAKARLMLGFRSNIRLHL